MKTTIRINKKYINENTYLRNESSILKETDKTITYEIHANINQSHMTEKQIKRNWNMFIW